MFKTCFKAVRAAVLAAFVLLIACEAEAQRVRLKQLERYLGAPIGPGREWYIGITDTFGDQRYKRIDTLIGYIADSISTLNDTDTDEQYVDSFYIDDDTLYISLIRGGPTKKVDLKPYIDIGNDIQYIDTFYFDMDTLYISIVRDGVGLQKVYLGDLISLADQDKQRHDTAFILDDILYLSLQRDSIAAHQIDLSPYLDNTDSQVFLHSGTTNYTNELSGSGGTNFTLIGGTGITISHDGSGNVTITNALGPDDDWWKVSTTVPPNNSEDAFRTGKTGIGMNPVYILDVSEDSRIYGHQIGRGGGNISGNFRAGLDALSSNTTGYFLTAVGAYALDANTTAYENTAVGYKSLWKLTTGIWNTALGAFSMENCITCFDNTAIGLYALNTMSSGQQNTALGHGAGYSNTTGGGNTFLGDLAGFTDSFPTRNVAIGQYSMEFGKTHLGNIAIGYQTINPISGGYNNTYNVAIGYQSVSTSTLNNADYNIAIGHRSLYNITGGDENIAIGNGAGTALSGNKNTMIGSGNTVTGGVDNNVIIGYNQTMTTAGNVVITNGAGTLGFKMLSTGLVGIGETTPTQKLHVPGNVRVTGAYYDSNNDPGTSGQILSSSVTGTDWINASSLSTTDLGFTGSGPYTLNSGTGGTDVTFTAGSGISLSGTSSNLTISATGVSVNLNRGPGGTGEYGVYPSSGTGVGIAASSGIIIGASGGSSSDIYIQATDASISNEGSLSVGAGSGTTSLIQSNTSGSGTITLTAGTGVTLTENTGAGTITISAPAVGTVTSVAMTGTTGIGVSGSPITSSGTFTLSLNNDLQALEGIGTTGIAVRTGAATWTTRQIDVSGTGLFLTNGTGVSGNPTLSLNAHLQSIAGIGSTGFMYSSSVASWSTLAFTNFPTGFSAGRVLYIGADNTPEVDDDFLYNPGTNALSLSGSFAAGGSTVSFSGIPTYASDAAAGSGGLGSGRVYRTAGGELRIKL